MHDLFYFRTRWKYLGKRAFYIFRFSASRGGDVSVRAANTTFRGTTPLYFRIQAKTGSGKAKNQFLLIQVHFFSVVLVCLMLMLSCTISDFLQ
jgi:hypothetical protein